VVTDVRAALRRIWERVLGVADVSPEDDFFVLGGDSVAAVDMVASVRGELALAVPLRAVFDTPMFEDFARAVYAAGTPQAGGPVPATERPSGELPCSDPARAPLSFQQEAMLYRLRRFDAHTPFHLPCAFELAGHVDIEALAAAFDDVVIHQPALRTVLRPAHGEYYQEVLPAPARRVLTVTAVDSLEDRAFRQALMRQLERRFNPAAGPMLRTALYHARDRAILSFTAHHIVFDRWSCGVVMRELSQAYADRRRGRDPRWQPLACSYADYARWQRDEVSGTVLEKHLDHWRSVIAGYTGRVQWPPGASPHTSRLYSAESLPVNIEADVLKRLAGFARTARASLFMVLLAAAMSALARATGQSDILVASATANRELERIADTVGAFTGGLMTRLRIRPDESFSDLVSRVRQQWLDAEEHRDLQLEYACHALNVPDIANVKVSLHDAPWLPSDVLDLHPARVAPLPLPPERTSRRDLDLNWTPRGERLEGTLTHRTAVVSSATARRIRDCFAAVLNNALGIIDQPP
jgi:acyl carrier protein